jgi:hypothetical protein
MARTLQTIASQFKLDQTDQPAQNKVLSPEIMPLPAALLN